jgi:hypothetical protein
MKQISLEIAVGSARQAKSIGSYPNRSRPSPNVIALAVMTIGGSKTLDPILVVIPSTVVGAASTVSSAFSG